MLAGLLALTTTVAAAIAIATGSPNANAANPIARGTTATHDGGHLAEPGGRPRDGGPRAGFAPAAATDGRRGQLIVRVAKPGAHDMLVVFADALGFAAMSLLSLQVFSSGRWAATTRPFGLRRVLSLHRQAGMAALILVVAHVAILFADDPARLALLDVPTAPGRARAGVAALLSLLGLAGPSVWRRHVRLRYE